MAKTGRPKKDPTTLIRVPRDLYLMLHWVADSQRVDLIRLVDRLLRPEVAPAFLRRLPEIRQRKASEDAAAKLEGREAMELPELVVAVASTVTTEKGTRKINPKDFGTDGRSVLPAGEIGDDALRRLIELNAVSPATTLPRPTGDDGGGA